ncbi:MAG: diguanylate cyclase, partial [Chloroflexota bacterium]|nr:diguanylate cyclase [Chloroflexota bacterium]
MPQQSKKQRGSRQYAGKTLERVIHATMALAALAILGATGFSLVGDGKWPFLVALSLVAAIIVYLEFLLLSSKQREQTKGWMEQKSGLWSSDYFTAALSNELERARRFTRHLSLLVVEVATAPANVAEGPPVQSPDLRHEVISAITAAVRKSVRQYDVSTWLDDKKIVILLPETNPFEALIVARRVVATSTSSRSQAQDSKSSANEGIKLGVGVACFPGDSVNGTELVTLAKEAAGHARSRSANGVMCAPDIPREEDR